MKIRKINTMCGRMDAFGNYDRISCDGREYTKTFLTEVANEILDALKKHELTRHEAMDLLYKIRKEIQRCVHMEDANIRYRIEKEVNEKVRKEMAERPWGIPERMTV